eukprot:CAMPEP_0172713202 /NCGR_PEP_ID=MMETSP1074-20121228/61630_1 /TAXON_ID=2916 /ORGANISM="Ceratium fusus, Strain PA161109" /LENGTH=68 /DNA_ID=CAMNT_0013537243 /DNA_START=34 /DNA_END=237 /DNA_ORIENTATION=+
MRQAAMADVASDCVLLSDAEALCTDHEGMDSCHRIHLRSILAKGALSMVALVAVLHLVFVHWVWPRGE